MENNIKPTLSKPVNKMSKNYQNDFDDAMGNNGDILNEVDGLLNEKEQSLKKKIFSLAKMEALVFSDPKLTAVYDEMAANGEEKYGYHYNETIMNMLFNDYVLNSAKYLQKYKMAIPKKKKRRDKSGINQLKKSNDVDFTKTEPQNTNETTSSASSGAYVGPAAWGDGDLMKGKSSLISRSPIWNGGTIIQESNYLTDVSGFKKYYELLNEDTGDYITDNTNAFSSGQVDSWNDNDKAIEVNTINSGKMDESDDFMRIKGEIGQSPDGADFRCDDKGNMQLFYYSDNNNAKQWAQNASKKYNIPAFDTKNIGNKKINEQMGVDEYTLKVKHDKGTVNIKTTASSEEAAIGNVMKAENCPRGAILSVSKTKKISESFDNNVDERESLEYFLSFNNNDIYWDWINEEISSQEAISMVYELNGIQYDPNINYKQKYSGMDEESMIDDNQSTMAFKAQPTGTISASGNVPTGLNTSTGMNETDEFITDLNEEFEKIKKQQEKLRKMTEDRKPSSLVLKDRLGDENKKNFQNDLKHSGTKEIIDVEKELMWKDQQTDIKDPQKFNQDIEKEVLKKTKGVGFENVGDSTNEKGNEIPKRNLTQEEQDEVNNYRLGLGDYIYSTKPSEKFEERMKQDMGDVLYKQRQDKLKFRGQAPMYNKDPQPVQTTNNKKDEYNKYNMSESMITGRYKDFLNKSNIIDFTINEVVEINTVRQTGLFKLDFTGLGNSYSSKSVDNKIIINEGVVDLLNKNEFYTDGTKIYMLKGKTIVNENTEVKKNVINEDVNKMKHLLNFNSSKFVDTRNVKKDRGF